MVGAPSVCPGVVAVPPSMMVFYRSQRIWKHVCSQGIVHSTITGTQCNFVFPVFIFLERVRYCTFAFPGICRQCTHVSIHVQPFFFYDFIMIHTAINTCCPKQQALRGPPWQSEQPQLTRLTNRPAREDSGPDAKTYSSIYLHSKMIALLIKTHSRPDFSLELIVFLFFNR